MVCVPATQCDQIIYIIGSFKQSQIYPHTSFHLPSFRLGAYRGDGWWHLWRFSFKTAETWSRTSSVLFNWLLFIRPGYNHLPGLVSHWCDSGSCVLKNCFYFCKIFMENHMVIHCNNMAQWSRGMIRASGARGPGFKSRLSPPMSSTILDRRDE